MYLTTVAISKQQSCFTSLEAECGLSFLKEAYIMKKVKKASVLCKIM